MKVLVTGAAGFIGSHVTDRLLRAGHEVAGLDAFTPHYDPRLKRRNVERALANPGFRLHVVDVRDAVLEAIVDRERPEAVVHLAACVSNRASISGGDEYREVNVGGTANLLRACRPARPRAFVFVSTSNVYDDRAPLPSREDETPLRPRTPYAESKREGERLALEGPGGGAPAGTVLRLFTVHGPRQRPDMAQQRWCEALEAGRPVPLIGDGTEERDFVYVEDAAEAIAAAVERPCPGEAINVGSGVATRIGDALERLASLLGRPWSVERLDMDARDTRKSLASIAKAARLLGWRPRVAPADGLAAFVEWRRREAPFRMSESGS